jgi:hypothetical protein
MSRLQMKNDILQAYKQRKRTVFVFLESDIGSTENIAEVDNINFP